MKSMFAVVFGAAVANASLNNRFANGTTTVAPTATGGVVYTTEVVDVYTTYCPEAGLVHVQNKTYTITTPTMLTITDCPCTIHKPVHTNTPVPDECAQKCMAEYRKCQTTPDANFSSCAAKLAACVNYNPFGETFVPPVACSAQGGAPTGTSPAIGTAPGGGATPEPTQPSGPAGSTGPSSTPNPTAGAGQLTPALALLALGAAVLL